MVFGSSRDLTMASLALVAGGCIDAVPPAQDPSGYGPCPPAAPCYPAEYEPPPYEQGPYAGDPYAPYWQPQRAPVAPPAPAQLAARGAPPAPGAISKAARQNDDGTLPPTEPDPPAAVVQPAVAPPWYVSLPGQDLDPPRELGVDGVGVVLDAQLRPVGTALKEGATCSSKVPAHDVFTQLVLMETVEQLQAAFSVFGTYKVGAAAEWSQEKRAGLARTMIIDYAAVLDPTALTAAPPSGEYVVDRIDVGCASWTLLYGDKRVFHAEVAAGFRNLAGVGLSAYASANGLSLTRYARGLELQDDSPDVLAVTPDAILQHFHRVDDPVPVRIHVRRLHPSARSKPIRFLPTTPVTVSIETIDVKDPGAVLFSSTHWKLRAVCSNERRDLASVELLDGEVRAGPIVVRQQMSLSLVLPGERISCRLEGSYVRKTLEERLIARSGLLDLGSDTRARVPVQGGDAHAQFEAVLSVERSRLALH